LAVNLDNKCHLKAKIKDNRQVNPVNILLALAVNLANKCLKVFLLAKIPKDFLPVNLANKCLKVFLQDKDNRQVKVNPVNILLVLVVNLDNKCHLKAKIKDFLQDKDNRQVNPVNILLLLNNLHKQNFYD